MGYRSWTKRPALQFWWSGAWQNFLWECHTHTTS